MKALIGFGGFGGPEIALREAGTETLSIELDPAIADVSRLNGGNVITADLLGTIIVDLPKIWYNYNCLGVRFPGRFAFYNADNQHNTYCEQGASYQTDSRSAVHLSNVGISDKERLAMPRKTKVQHSFRDSIEGKNCLSCQAWLPLSEYNIDLSKRGGFNIYCKLCRKEKRTKTADDYNAKRRMIYAKAPDEIRQRNKEWREANKETVNRNRRERYAANPEKYRKQGRDFYRKNQSRILRNTKEKRANNPLKHREWSRRWARENPQQRKIQAQKRRALLNDSDGSYTLEEWNNLKAFYEFKCLKCKRQEPEVKITADHVIPLSKGGSNTIDNIQPLCFQCNSGKRDRIKDYR